MRLEVGNIITYISLLFAMLFMNRVTLFDGTKYDTNVVGFNQYKDVAVLHVEELEGKVKPVSIGLSANLIVGQKVFAIGFPVSMSF